MNKSTLRIYPLSDEEFSDVCATRCYFEHSLKEQCGKFKYRNRPIVADSGTIVLFQYEQHIIAQAEFLKICKYEEPIIENGVEYHGHFLFDIDSVHYYSEALSAEEFYSIYPDKTLGRPTHILDDEEKNKQLLKMLEGKM
jgi:hypothetical protein